MDCTFSARYRKYYWACVRHFTFSFSLFFFFFLVFNQKPVLHYRKLYVCWLKIWPKQFNIWIQMLVFYVCLAFTITDVLWRWEYLYALCTGSTLFVNKREHNDDAWIFYLFCENLREVHFDWISRVATLSRGKTWMPEGQSGTVVEEVQKTPTKIDSDHAS